MNCSKCNSKLKDGAKFCTSCGSPVAASNDGGSVGICKKCSAPLKPNARFCTSCGEKTETQTNVQTPAQESNEMQVVKQRIFWNIQQGEIARKINEAEFIQYDSALGLIINDGTTAYIRSEGKQIAEIKGGAYNFVEPKELDKILESRTGGVAGGIKHGFKFLINLVLGQKVKDRVEDKNLDPKQQSSLDSIIECMKGDSLLSLTLKLDKDFELIFGSAQPNIDNYADFSPMSIKTKYLDVNIGVRAIFKITDFQKFAQYYLSDRSVVSTSFLADKLTPIIKAAVQDAMGDVENMESRLSDDILSKIRNKIISSSNELMYGIALENIVEIISENEDIERFRALSRELYLSEKELDYLNRTNDFKNRLSTVAADQTIYEEQSEFELKKRLDNINKDKILHEDELEKFAMALQVDKIIRTAKSEEEVEIALSEIKKRGLLREGDFDKLEDSVRNGKYDRDLTFDLMQIRGDAERSRAQIELERSELERIRQQRLGMADIEVQEQKLKDDYEIDKQKRARSAEMDLDERAAESSLERLRRIKEMEAAEQTMRHKQELEQAAQNQQYHLKELETKYAGAQNLSPQQLMAIAANENLDPVAAAKFAESFSATMNAEQQTAYIAEFNKLNQARIDDKDKDADRMERMMAEMMATARTMTGHLVQSKDEQKNEYRERMTRQEDRVDRTQERALEYTTRNNAINTPPPPMTQQVVYFISMPNGESVPHSLQQIQQLIQQGTISAGAYIYPSDVAKWVIVSTLKELAHLFKPAPQVNMNESSVVCGNCGLSLKTGEKFCENCGKSVE